MIFNKIVFVIFLSIFNCSFLNATKEYKEDLIGLKAEVWTLLKNERARVKNASRPLEQESKDFYFLLSTAKSNKQLDALFADTNQHNETILDYAFVIAQTEPEKGWMGDFFYMSPLQRSRFLELILSFYPPLVVKDQEGKTPLHKAVMLGNNELVFACFHEAVINEQDKNGCTPAHYAQYQGVLQFLINAGADLSIKNWVGVAVEDTFTSIFDLYPVPLIDRCEAKLCPECLLL